MRDAIHPMQPEHRATALPLRAEQQVFSTSTVTLRGDTGTRALHRVMAFIEANLGEPFSLEILARQAGVSRFHFARKFRQATGFSPMEYLMRRRIEHGKRILAHGKVSICDVAASLGFCDQSHFTRTFRRMTGQSPREYARRRANV